MKLYCVLVALGIFLVLSSTIKSSEIQPSAKQKADIALHGMEDAIIRINSGICQISGQTIQPGDNVVVDSIFIAFDYKKHFYRLDNSDKGRSLYTPDFYFEVWKPGTHDASAHRFTHADMKISHWLNMVDIQALPYFVPIGKKEPFDFMKNYQPMIYVNKLIGYEEKDNDIVCLKFDMVRDPGAMSVQMEYWLSKKYDYLPIHIDFSVGCTMDISWKKINETYVPTAYIQKSKQGFGVEWKIVWKTVNEPVPTEYFDVSKLTEEEVPLFSTELGEPVIIGKIGKGIPFSEAAIPSKNVSYFRYFLFAAGLIMILLALGKKIYNWKTKRS